MKKILLFINTVLSCLLIALATTSCSTNMFNNAAGGAATGAVSASFVGGVTDLILYGKVNTDRLARNMVGGAVGGATAGAIVGAKQDQATPQAPAEQQEADTNWSKEMGKENYAALNDLLNYNYKDAYRKTLKTTKSTNEEQKEAGYAIQALIDKDRGNTEGMNAAIDTFLELNSDFDRVQTEEALTQLTSDLNDERSVQGIRKP